MPAPLPRSLKEASLQGAVDSGRTQPLSLIFQDHQTEALQKQKNWLSLWFVMWQLIGTLKHLRRRFPGLCLAAVDKAQEISKTGADTANVLGATPIGFLHASLIMIYTFFSSHGAAFIKALQPCLPI